jgi:plasmid stabilization system protein ParE
VLPLVLRSVAETEVAEAVEWYAARSPDLAARFLLALDETFQRVRRSPESCLLIHPPLRRSLLVHFPYAVFYRVYPDRIAVVAVIHARRDPRRRRART